MADRLFVPIVCVLIYVKLVDVLNQVDLNFALILLVLIYIWKHLKLE